ncbi:retrovirus-related pol polyprotein from transposon TNT 1-94 [Tanacetum coccineum]|uniref:Retrovirus-related pol polyprotein from transposon TNT 1-94 n=1 Tax=Tanacetum coccineum TaxID=301880 RepID=A0ABQ4ZG31_9ASTR
MNSVINCLTAKSTWDDLILYHEGPFDVKESRVMNLKLCYNTFKFKEGETLTQSFTRYKALMNELVNDGITLLKLEINTSFINGLPKEWLSFCQSLKNTNHVKDSELASLFGKLKYEENLIDNIYETEKNKSLVSTTPLSTAFISTSIVQDFQDSPDDEEDIRSSYEYLNDIEEEYQARAQPSLKDSSRRVLKGLAVQKQLTKLNATNVARKHKLELRPTKDFEAKYNKVKAKLALLSSSALASKAVTVKNKGLIAKAYEWYEEEVSSDGNEMVEVKVLMALAEENDAVSKEGTRNGEWVKISMRKVHALLEMEDNDDRKTYVDHLYIDLNYVKEQRNNLLSKQRDLHVNTEILKENKNLRTELKELTTVTETWLNSSNKVNQCINEQIPSQKKRILGVDQLIEDPSSSGQKDLVFVKSLADDTKVSIPHVERPWLSEAEATEYDSADESLVCSTPLPPLKKLDGAEPTSRSKTIKSILRSKSIFKAEALKGVKINEPSSAPAKGNKSSSALKVNSAPVGKLKSVKIEDDPPLAIVCDIRKPISYLDSGCSRHMTGVKSYLHKIEEQPGPKVVFGDDSTCVTKGYGSIKCNESCFLAKASKNLNWLWHKRLAYLNFKTINKLAKQNLVIGLPSLVYLKDKPCSSCEKRKHHRASFKTKQTSSIKKCLHLLYMDLFVTSRSINHEKYTIVIVDEYLRYTWVYFLKKKSQAPETIMSFIKRVENQNDIKVKQLTDNGTEFRNSILVNFCDEKWISQNFSSPYTPEQNGIAERKNRTLIEAARTMLLGSVFSKQYWTEAISEHSSSPREKDTPVENTILIPNLPLPIPSVATPAPQDRWSQDKHIELVNTIGNPGAGMFTRAMAKELGAASAHECLFVDFLSEEEPKKVSVALQHPGWVDAMQDELNQLPEIKSGH